MPPVSSCVLLDTRKSSTMATGDTSVRPSMSSSKRHPWTLNFNARHKEYKPLELPSPPGYSASVGQVHADEKRDTDPVLVAKVRVTSFLT